MDLFRKCMHDHYPIELDEIVEEYFTENGMRLIGLGDEDVFSKVDAINNISEQDVLKVVKNS